MEKGFYHPQQGYWQAISDVPESIRASYPEGTIEVPLKPGQHFDWDGTKWVPVAPPSPTANEVRAKRNALLSGSDWTQVADAPVDQQAWAAYRQALRDIPEQPGFPHDIIWPVAPV